MTSAYIHAALLLHFAKQPVNEDSLKKVVKAAGLSADDGRIKALATAISEVNIEEVVKSPPVGVAPPPPSEPKAEKKPKKEEEKKEKKGEEAMAGLGALFG